MCASQVHGEESSLCELCIAWDFTADLDDFTADLGDFTASLGGFRLRFLEACPCMPHQEKTASKASLWDEDEFEGVPHAQDTRAKSSPNSPSSSSKEDPRKQASLLEESMFTTLSQHIHSSQLADVASLLEESLFTTLSQHIHSSQLADVSSLLEKSMFTLLSQHIHSLSFAHGTFPYALGGPVSPSFPAR
jgi:hypothetical protein